MKDIVEVSTKDAYRMAMKSMLSWVRKNMDPEKTRVFFAGMSPSHQKLVISLFKLINGRFLYNIYDLTDDLCIGASSGEASQMKTVTTKHNRLRIQTIGDQIVVKT